MISSSSLNLSFCSCSFLIPLSCLSCSLFSFLKQLFQIFCQSIHTSPFRWGQLLEEQSPVDIVSLVVYAPPDPGLLLPSHLKKQSPFMSLGERPSAVNRVGVLGVSQTFPVDAPAPLLLFPLAGDI